MAHKWPESTCTECGKRMESGCVRKCELGRWCNWHIPIAVREHLEALERNHAQLVEALKAILTNQSSAIAIPDLEAARKALADAEAE